MSPFDPFHRYAMITYVVLHVAYCPLEPLMYYL